MTFLNSYVGIFKTLADKEVVIYMQESRCQNQVVCTMLSQDTPSTFLNEIKYLSVTVWNDNEKSYINWSGSSSGGLYVCMTTTPQNNGKVSWRVD